LAKKAVAAGDRAARRRDRGRACLSLRRTSDSAIYPPGCLAWRPRPTWTPPRTSEPTGTK